MLVVSCNHRIFFFLLLVIILKIFHFRAAHYGELASECVKLYYKYGCALLYKAQEEADPLGAVPKKEGQSDKAESAKSAVNGESSKASVSSNAEVVDGVTDDGRCLHHAFPFHLLGYFFVFTFMFFV